MKPTDEQIKKFWEWCGFKIQKRYEDLPRGRVTLLDYVSPIGEILGDYPPIDLNNLFEYAGPKLLDEGWDIMISCNQEFKTWDVELSHPTKQAILEQETILVNALFWAIYSLWEVIHKGNDET